MCVATSVNPKLIFSCGYGELLGGGFEGEAIEVDAHIAEAREASGSRETLLLRVSGLPAHLCS